jgi:hypothetical protein
MSLIDDQRKRRQLLFGQRLDERGLEVLERKFECHLPCFLRVGADGGFDPLDAMRRDAYREVCNWLRDQLKTYRKETNNE